MFPFCFFAEIVGRQGVTRVSAQVVGRQCGTLVCAQVVGRQGVNQAKWIKKSLHDVLVCFLIGLSCVSARLPVLSVSVLLRCRFWLFFKLIVPFLSDRNGFASRGIAVTINLSP